MLVDCDTVFNRRFAETLLEQGLVRCNHGNRHARHVPQRHPFLDRGCELVPVEFSPCRQAEECQDGKNQDMSAALDRVPCMGRFLGY